MPAAFAIATLAPCLLIAEPLPGRRRQRLMLPMLLHVLVDLRAAFMPAPADASAKAAAPMP